MRPVVAARFWRHAGLKDAIVWLHKAVLAFYIFGAMGVPALKRLRRQVDFQQVRSSGKRMSFGPFILQWFSRAELPGVRIGIIASRRVGNAVKRNRGKRLLREIFRAHEANLPQSLDLVIVLRKGYDKFAYADLEQAFLKGCTQINTTTNNL